MRVGSHRELIVWQKAVSLAVRSHLLARTLPASERFELGSQMRRAAASIPANIAEGNGRTHRKEYVHFLAISRAWSAELQTYLEMMHHLRYGDEGEVSALIRLSDEVGRMLTALIRRLRNASPSH